MRNLFAMFLGSTLCMGCVGKGRHELIEVQLDATRTALSARTAQCTVGQLELQAQLDRLTRDLRIREAQLSELSLETTEREDELAALYVSVTHLQAELAALQGGAEVPEGEAPELVVDTRLAEGLAALSRAEEVEARRERSEAAVRAAFAGLVEAERVTVIMSPRGAVVRVRTGLLFQEGWTVLSPRGEEIVGELATALQALPGRTLVIEGHTDDQPRHSAQFPSNWERGFGYAMLLLQALDAAKVPLQMSAGSYAGTQPIATNDTPEGRAQNQRLELVIGLQAVELPSPVVPEEPAPEGAGEAAAPSEG